MLDKAMKEDEWGKEDEGPRFGRPGDGWKVLDSTNSEALKRLEESLNKEVSDISDIVRARHSPLCSLPVQRSLLCHLCSVLGGVFGGVCRQAGFCLPPREASGMA